MPFRAKWRADEYVDLVIDEMLPRVASEKLAEFCDVFCERGYFDIEQSRKILTAAKQARIETAGACRSAHKFRRREIDGGIESDDRGSFGENGRAGDRGDEIGGCSAGLAAGIGLCAWIERLSARARNDRGRTGGRARDRFQSRLVADAEHADDSVARLHANENVAGGSYHRSDNQCGLQSRIAATRSVRSNRASSPTSRSSIARIIASSPTGLEFRRRIRFTCGDRALRVAAV